VTRYVLSDDADRDLDGIWDYIAKDVLTPPTIGSAGCSMRLVPLLTRPV